ncbi:MAG: Na+/H+ antiporter NhaA [Actinomycetota bacterium]
MSAGEPVRHTWSESDRFVPRTVVRPLQRFMDHEAAGGVVMVLAAIAALIWANSPWRDSYTEFWHTYLVVELGDLIHLDHLDLQAWVNDALMTLFFLLVGLEIKREIVHGELRDVRAVALPVIAALGGMIVPAGIYFALNSGGPGADGWGIPMATDIAFAVGVVSLLGSRVPLAAKIFLLTLAVADDIGAIVVIAVFYTEDLSFGWFGVAIGALVVAHLMRRSDVHSMAPYLAVGFIAWLGLLESGVHATLAGVALGLMTPAWPLRTPTQFPAAVREVADRVEGSFAEPLTSEDLAEDEHLIAEVVRLSHQTISPLERIERALAPWVAYVIVPIFALANAGVQVSADTLGDLASNDVTLGVMLGLVVGKTVGVFGATTLAVKLGVGRLPTGTTFRHVFGLAVCAGIGFTVALFVTSISLEGAAADSAKVGILLASTLAGVVGFLLLRSTPPTVDAGTSPHEEPVPVPAG